MDFWQILVYVILPILVTYMGYNERDKAAMKKELRDTYSKDNTEHLIDLKNKPIEVLQQETIKDVKEVGTKLDKIEDLLRRLTIK